MDLFKAILITALIILSLASGYLKGKKKYISLVILGLLLSFYVVKYLY